MVTHKNNPSQQYILKYHQTDRTSSEIESFNAWCYKLLLDDRHPVNISVINKNLKRIGVASQLEQGYQSIGKLIETQNLRLTNDLILKSEMIKVWAAAYCENETDLTLYNYGFNNSGMIMKIDDDRSSWPLTSKYFGVDPSYGQPFDNYYSHPPGEDFPVTEGDIAALPVVKDMKPERWIDNIPEIFQNVNWQQLYKQEKFSNDKFYIFLKRILCDREVYDLIAGGVISSANSQSKHAKDKADKSQTLQAVLLNMPEFQQYIVKYPAVIISVMNDFAKFNKLFADNDYPVEPIDTNRMIQRYLNLLGLVCDKNKKYIEDVYEGLLQTEYSVLNVFRSLPENHSLKKMLSKVQLQKFDEKYFDFAYEKSIKDMPLTLSMLANIIKSLASKLTAAHPQAFFKSHRLPLMLVQLNTLGINIKDKGETKSGDELPDDALQVVQTIICDYIRTLPKGHVTDSDLLNATYKMLLSTSSMKTSKMIIDGEVPGQTFVEFMDRVLKEYKAYCTLMLKNSEEEIEQVKRAADFIFARYPHVSCQRNSIVAPKGVVERSNVEFYLKTVMEYAPDVSADLRKE